MSNKEIKEKISKILIKWGMPTRQVAIGEILELFGAHNQEILEKIVGEIFFELQEKKNKLIKPLKRGEIQKVGEKAIIESIEVVQHFLLTKYNIDLNNYIEKLKKY